MAEAMNLPARSAMASLRAELPRCRFCGSELHRSFVDLGLSPLCQNHIEPSELNAPEPFYPLHVWVCDSCLLVQLEEYVSPTEIFSDYAYFSSYSASWVEHARRYCEAMIERLGLTESDRVVEVASNDGYLLQHFLARGIPVHGVEPAANVAEAAREKGIPCTLAFFGRATAEQLAGEIGRPRLLLGNNVLAHVPDINDFVGGLATLVSDDGVVTMEFPHLLRLMQENQFDTIYHEHFSYLSLTFVQRLFAHHGLRLFDVEQLRTHGGSLRIFATPAPRSECPGTGRVEEVLAAEGAARLQDPSGYTGFGERVCKVKRDLLRFLIDARDAGKRVVGYGAPGKGNTLLNYCGIRTDLLDFTVDASPHKQGRFTPGARLPILAPDAIRDARPDYVLILPWNLEEEIQHQLRDIRSWGGQCVVPIPELRVLDW